MRILILGAGGIGGYFGARLIEAGGDVSFLVRPARAALLAKQGLHVYSSRGDFSHSVRAITEVDAPYDLAILSCKAYDLDAAIASIRPAIGAVHACAAAVERPASSGRAGRGLREERVLGGLCHISVTLEEDGAIRQFGALERLTFGSRQPAQPVPAWVGDALRALGSHAIESDDVIGAMWDKFAFIATLAGITCLMRGAIGDIVATAEGADLVRRLQRECTEVAARSGHALTAAATESALGILTTMASPLKASMLRDLERGARSECEHIFGDLRTRAIGFGIDTPLLAAALTQLRVYEGARVLACLKD